MFTLSSSACVAVTCTCASISPGSSARPGEIEHPRVVDASRIEQHVGDGFALDDNGSAVAQHTPPGIEDTGIGESDSFHLGRLRWHSVRQRS